MILLLSLLAFSLSLKTKIKIKTTPAPEVASLKKNHSKLDCDETIWENWYLEN